MYDDFLRIDLPAGTSIIGFADDALVVCAADEVGILELTISDSLRRAKRWLDSRCLKMAPEKTEALMVTDRRSFQYLKIVLGEHEIDWKKSIKYLGKETFQLRKELTCLTNPQEIARAKEAIRKDGRRRLVEKWQTRWHGDQSGRRTHRLIPEIATWLDRKHDQVGSAWSKRFRAMVALMRT